MPDDREKSSEKFSYSVNYGDLRVKVDTTISQTRKDSGDKDTYLHRTWDVKKEDNK